MAGPVYCGSPQSKFHYKKKDKQYTYAQYMTERYGIKNSDMDKKQPLLEHESKTEHDRCCGLIAAVCGCHGQQGTVAGQAPRVCRKYQQEVPDLCGETFAVALQCHFEQVHAKQAKLWS